MTTATHNYGWLMPDPGGSANTWGNILNGTTQAIDANLWSINAQLTSNTLDLWRGPDGGAYGSINFGNQGNTQLRWLLGETSEAETGGNAGTNFLLNAYDDSGNYLNVFEVIRATQTVSFAKTVTANVADVTTINCGSIGAGTLSVASGGTVSGGLTVNNSLLVASGLSTFAGGVNGATNFNNNITVAGTATVSGLSTFAGGVNGATNFNNNIAVAGTATVTGALSVSGAISGTSITVSSLSCVGNASISGSLNIGAGGNLTVANGWMAATGTLSRNGIGGTSDGNQYNHWWSGTQNTLWLNNSNWGQIQTNSDYRMKKDVQPLGSTWNAVKALNPISYTHRDWTPPASVEHQNKVGGSLIRSDNVERWGFLAHELQETLVESAANGVKDDPVAVQSPNPFTVIAALTKALQEAMMRIEALEGRGR